MAAIPKLRLATVECGGGWGLGDRFSSLPSHEQQRAQEPSLIFTVAKTTNKADRDSSDDESVVSAPQVQPAVQAPSHHLQVPIPSTQYQCEKEDDDDTFVDHGSSTDMKQSNKESCKEKESGGDAPSKQPADIPKNHSLPAVPLSDVTSEDDDDEFWEGGRMVSRVQINQPIFSMAVAVGGKSLWAAIGDDPLILFELSGCGLTQQRSIQSIHSVRSLAVVTIPPAKAAPVSFKQYGNPRSPMPLSRSNSTNAPLATMDPPPSSGASEVLWCGLDRGRIAIVDLFFFNEDGFISQAHGTSAVCGIWPMGNTGRVWSAGEDHSLKLWDAGSRKLLRQVPKTAERVVDVCHIPSTGHCWMTCREPRIFIFDHDGKEVRPPSKVTSNAYFKTKSKVHAIRHHAPSSSVWVCLDFEISIFNPKTLDIHSVLTGLSCKAIEMKGDFAIVVAHGPSAGDEQDHILILNAMDPRNPQLTKVGAAVDSVSKVGLRCFPRAPLGAVAHTVDQQRCITIFTTEETEPIGNWSVTASKSIKRSSNEKSAPGGVVLSHEQVAPSVVVETAGNSSFRQASPHTAYEASSTTMDDECTTRIIQSSDDLSSQRPPNSAGGLNTAPSDRNERIVPRAPQVPPQQMMIDPSLNASVSALLKEQREIANGLRQMRMGQPVQEDFSRLYAYILRVSCTHPELAPPSSNCTVCTTYEGKLMYETIERLVAAVDEQKVADLDENNADDGREASVRVHEPSPVSPQASLVATNRGHSSTLGGAANPSSLVSPNEAFLHKQLYTMIKANELQKKQHAEVTAALQRQNKLLEERLNAFVKGVGVLEGSLMAHSRRLMAIASGDADRQEQDSAMQNVEVLSSLSASSSPSEIRDAIQSAATLFGNLLSSKDHWTQANMIAEGDTAALRSPSALPTARDRNTVTPRPSAAVAFVGSPAPSPAAAEGSASHPYDESPPPVVVMRTPKRMLDYLKQEFLEPVMRFTRTASEQLRMLEAGSLMFHEDAADGYSESLDRSHYLHDMSEASLVCSLCYHETMCSVVEEITTQLSEEHEERMQQDWDSEPLFAAAREEKELIDDCISHMTEVSMELEAIGSTIRKSLVERYLRPNLSTNAARASGFSSILNSVKPMAGRLRGLLAWDHVVLRFLALSMEETQSKLFKGQQVPLSARLGGSLTISVNAKAAAVLPRGDVEFILDRLKFWRSELSEMRSTIQTFFTALSDAQRSINERSTSLGDRSVALDGLKGSSEGTLTKSSLISLCLQHQVRKATATSLPLLLTEELHKVQCDEEIFSVIGEILENTGAILQTKIEALLPVCTKLELVVQASLSSHKNEASHEVDAADDSEEIAIVIPLAVSKPPLEECHKQFCMSV